MTTQPTPSTVTASVSSPTPIPERPTLYTLLRCRGTFWDVGFPSVNRETLDKAAQHEPGSVLVTIPGTATPESKPEPKDGSAKVGDDAPCWVPRCCHPGCMARVLNDGDKCRRHQPAPTPKAEPSPFAPLPEGWRPEGMETVSYRTDFLMGAHRPQREDALRAWDSEWLAELNRLRRELHDIRSAKGDKHE